MTAKIHFLDDVRSEDQVFQAELWTTWNRWRTPEGTREWEDKTRAYEESIRSPLPISFSIGLVPFANHRLWCMLVTSGVSTSARSLIDDAPALGVLTTDQIEATVFYEGDPESVMDLYRNTYRKKYPTLPEDANPLTAVRLMRAILKQSIQVGDEIGIRRVVTAVQKAEDAIRSLTQVDLQSRTSFPVFEE
jgi:hypothetical protein